MKELLFVCIGSFFGGGARYLVGKAVLSWVAVSFPWGTMAVNKASDLVLVLFFALWCRYSKKFQEITRNHKIAIFKSLSL